MRAVNISPTGMSKEGNTDCHKYVPIKRFPYFFFRLSAKLKEAEARGLRIFGSEPGNCMRLLGMVGTAVLC